MGKTRKGLKYIPQDEGYFEAKKRGFVARSALKLEELDRKFNIYKNAKKVLDLGCAPGSWLQYALQKVGPKGQLVGVDIAVMRIDLPQVKTFVADLNELTIDSEILSSVIPFDVIQSDAMVKTSGIPDSDCARSIALVESGVRLAKAGALKPDGVFLAKVFEGPGFTEFYTDFKKHFKKSQVVHADATRQGSREVYIYGQFSPTGGQGVKR
jgi:23S rRNA (uridine2552-2'-O)-methyltransferase